MDPIVAIADPKVAAHLLDPMRVKLLELGREPLSASQFAEKLGMQRQRVNYHVKQLRDAGLFVEAGRREKRNLTEVLYRSSAARYLIAPAALGPLAPAADSPGMLAFLDADIRLPSSSDEKALQGAINRLADSREESGQPCHVLAYCYRLPDKTR